MPEMKETRRIVESIEKAAKYVADLCSERSHDLSGIIVVDRSAEKRTGIEILRAHHVLDGLRRVRT